MTDLATRHARRYDGMPSLAKKGTSLGFSMSVDGEKAGGWLTMERVSAKSDKWTVWVDDAKDAADVWFFHITCDSNVPMIVIAAAMAGYTDTLRERKLLPIAEPTLF